MSILNDVFGLGRSSVTESFYNDNVEPEIQNMTLENAADIDDDPMDYMMQVAYENEINMKNIDMAIIAEEYCYLRENGQELVYEATSISTIIEKFKNAVKRLWERIQSFFKRVINELKEKINLDGRFLDKYKEKALKGGTGKVKGDESYFGVKTVGTEAEKILNKLSEQSNSIYDRLLKDEKLDLKTEWKRILSEVLDNTGIEGVNEKDIAKKILKSYTVDSKTEAKSFKAQDAIEAFEQSKVSLDSIKTVYETNKKAINAQIKTAKKMESNAKKFKVLPTDQSRAIHGGITILNKIGSTMTLVDRTTVKIIHKCRAFQKAVIVAAAAKAGATNANESATGFVEGLELL